MNSNAGAFSTEPARHEADYRAEAARLSRRIIIVASLLMGELTALTAALDAWADGRTSVVAGLLGFQLVLFLLALGISAAVPFSLRPTGGVLVSQIQTAPAE